jgi:glutamate N-acetyltransferase/amino-acid N-acetyltransferase
LYIQDTLVFQNGIAVNFDRTELRLKLKKDSVVINANLYSGDFNATAWGCDLSHKYVDINTEYS